MQPSQDDIRIRHGRLLPALSVARGARLRPGALGAHPQPPARIHPDDGPPAGPDGFDLQ